MALPLRWRLSSVAVAIAATIIALNFALGNAHLSKEEAVRIADRKVRQVLHYDLREYEIYFVKYFPEENKWRVNYRNRKWARNDFGVDINDRTRRAEVWLP